MDSLALVCRSGPILLALPLRSVAETLRPLPIERLAGQPGFVLGVSTIRGAPVPVVDVAALLGTASPEPPRRVVTLALGGRRVGLALDDVIGVRAIDAAQVHDVPPLLHEAAHDAVQALGALDGRLLVALRSAFALPPSVWASLEVQAS
jgi:purine-binding chemotaxis protein CheW